MKKILIAFLLMAGVIVAGFSQDLGRFFDNEKLKAELSLTDKEKTTLLALWEETEKTIRVAKADLEIKTAELKRILMEERTSQNQVEKALRDAMELEFKMRLAQITRMIKAKEILGANRWAILERFMRALGDRRTDGSTPQPDAPRNGRENPPERGNVQPRGNNMPDRR